MSAHATHAAPKTIGTAMNHGQRSLSSVTGSAAMAATIIALLHNALFLALRFTFAKMGIAE